MRIYEVMFIVRPDVLDEDLDKLIATFDGLVTTTGGKVAKVDKMGRRRLAYEVKRCREGHYVLFTVESEPATIKEFERRLKVMDSVIKYMTVRVDEELKRLAKIKKKREAKAARRRKPSAAGAAAPGAAPAASGAPAASAPVAPSAPPAAPAAAPTATLTPAEPAGKE